MNALIIEHLSIDTVLGKIWIGATPRGIFRLHFGMIDIGAIESWYKDRPEVRFREGGDRIEKAAEEVLDYLSGKLRTFSVKVDIGGSSQFYRRVWRATAKIPYGQVRTYGWIARKIGNPNMARAVGIALSRNPVPILIPCHRVVAAGDRLGGFSAGLKIKEELLAIESGQEKLRIS